MIAEELRRRQRQQVGVRISWRSEFGSMVVRRETDRLTDALVGCERSNITGVIRSAPTTRHLVKHNGRLPLIAKYVERLMVDRD